MRKVRDYDAELKALESRAKAIKARRIEQLGQLVTATCADALDMETLAGALLDAVAMKDAEAKEIDCVTGPLSVVSPCLRWTRTWSPSR